MSKHWGIYANEGRYRRCTVCGMVTAGFFGGKAKPLLHKGRKP